MNLIVIFWVGGSLALVLLISVLLFLSFRPKILLKNVLGHLVDANIETDDLQRQASAPLTDWLNKRMEGSSFGDRISKDLARADLKFKPGEFVAVILIAAVGLGVLWFISGRTLVVGIIGALIGAFFRVSI